MRNCIRLIKTRFRNYYKGYSKYCSNRCISNSNEVKNKKKKNNLKKYGVKYTSQIPENRQKYKETCKEKYGVENPSKLQTVKNKKRPKEIILISEHPENPTNR